LFLDDDPMWTATCWITQRYNKKRLMMNTCILSVECHDNNAQNEYKAYVLNLI